MTAIIPPITEPISWEQPDASRMLFDETHVVMSKRDFEALKEYSATNPSGVYVGKMWRRHDGAHDYKFLAGGGKPEWLLCWYGESLKGPGFCSNNFRKILIIENRNDN